MKRRYWIFVICLFVSPIAAALALQNPAALWKSNQLENPGGLAERLKSKSGKMPVMIQVGFETLYNSNHIPGSQFAGPASNPKGLELLRQKLASVSRDEEVILYCGCCPWDKCPNIRPAYDLAAQMGFKRVKALNIQSDLEKDWISKGYPIEKSKN